MEAKDAIGYVTIIACIWIDTTIDVLKEAEEENLIWYLFFIMLIILSTIMRFIIIACVYSQITQKGWM